MKERFPIALIAALMVLALPFTTAGANSISPMGIPTQSDGILITASDPMPAMIFANYDTTPDLYFTELVGATMYKVEVYNALDLSFIYSYKGTGICDNGLCYLTPDTPLAIYKWGSGTGYYQWRVKAKYSGFWQNWSDYATFAVLSDGFVSNFNLDKKGWKILNGSWSRQNPGYLVGKYDGSENWISVFQKNFSYDFTYQVKLKRTVSKTFADGIIFWGYPELGTAGLWTDGIYFIYTNDQYYCIGSIVNDSWTYIQDWNISTNINPYDWNTLTVVVQSPIAYFFINGRYIGWYLVSGQGAGWVGITITGLEGELMVDKASLDALMTYPNLYPDPAMELGKGPVHDGMVPWQSPGN